MFILFFRFGNVRVILFLGVCRLYIIDFIEIEDRGSMIPMKYFQDLQSGLETAFINQNINSNLAFRPEFVSNDSKRGRRVISSLKFCMANTTKTAVEIEWVLDTPVRDDIYQYIIG